MIRFSRGEKRSVRNTKLNDQTFLLSTDGNSKISFSRSLPLQIHTVATSLKATLKQFSVFMTLHAKRLNDVILHHVSMRSAVDQISIEEAAIRNGIYI